MANCSEIKSRLDNAIAARQRLIEGSAISVLMEGGTRVEYRQADLGSLNASIAQLQAEYNVCISDGSRVTPVTRPINFYF